MKNNHLNKGCVCIMRIVIPNLLGKKSKTTSFILEFLKRKAALQNIIWSIFDLKKNLRSKTKEYRRS